MAFTPLTFTGISKFSSDFGTILDRATKIAQLPVQQLTNRDSDALTKKALLGGLTSGASSLGESLTALGELSQKRALSASSSNTSVITTSGAGGESEAVYTINSVTSIATAASERTATGYADSGATPVGTTGDFKLVVGADHYDFTLSNNSLVGLRDKINTLGAGVTASILTTVDGNYLSVSSVASGEKVLQLRNDPAGVNTNLLTADHQGSNLQFSLNGIPVEQSTNFVNSVVPGLSFSVAAESASPVTLTVATDRSAIGSALQSFVSSYNSLRGQLNAQVGSAAGLLTGNTVVQQLQSQLRSLASHRLGEGQVRTLSDLGVSFDNSGKASFDSTKVDALSATAVNDAFTYLGSPTAGFAGFAQNIDQFTNPVTGLIQLEQNGLDRVDKKLQEQIAILNDRIAVMQKGLSLKLQLADSLLANLESQQNTITASLQGLSSVLYGKNQG